MGIQVANFVIRNGCNVAVGSRFGPKLEDVLKAGGVKLETIEHGSVKEVLGKIKTEA